MIDTVANAASFSGSGGSQVSVYVSTPDGQAFEAFTSGSAGVKVDRTSKPAKLFLGVGGPLCGQRITSDTPRSEYKGCWRPVDWSDKTKKFQFAPVSKIQPLK